MPAIMLATLRTFKYLALLALGGAVLSTAIYFFGPWGMIGLMALGAIVAIWFLEYDKIQRKVI